PPAPSSSAPTPPTQPTKDHSPPPSSNGTLPATTTTTGPAPTGPSPLFLNPQIAALAQAAGLLPGGILPTATAAPPPSSLYNFTDSSRDPRLRPGSGAPGPPGSASSTQPSVSTAPSSPP